MKKIKEIIMSPSFDREEALKLHKKMLLEKRARLDKVIATIDKTIQYTKGEIEMTNKEKFEGFDFSHNPYEEEARERWGDAAVDKANEYAKGMSKEKQEEFNAIYRNLAALDTVLQIPKRRKKLSKYGTITCKTSVTIH